MPEAPRQDESATPSEQVARRTLRQRRRRVWRSIALVIVLMLAMVVLSILNRDQQEIDACRERMAFATQEFQRLYDERGTTPSALPLPEGDAEARDRIRSHVLYNVLYTKSSRTEVGVCCCQAPHDPLFLPPGRHVIVFNVREGRYDLRWMSEDEFVRQADDLGLRVRLAP